MFKKILIIKEIKYLEIIIIVLLLMLVSIIHVDTLGKLKKIRNINSELLLVHLEQVQKLNEATITLTKIEDRLRGVEQWKILAQAFQDSLIAGRVVERIK